MKLEQTLTRRVGPVALWVWLLGLVAVLIFARRSKKSGGTTSGTDTTGTTADTSAATGYGTAALGGGGDLGQPLQPTEQQPVDSAIGNGGTGTPVVFDPYSDPYAPPNDGVVGPSAPAATPPARAGRILLPGGAIYDPSTDTVTPGVSPIVRPAATRAPARKAATWPAMYPGGVSATHPNANTTITTLANGQRVEQVAGKTAYSIGPVRAASSEAPNSARTVAPVASTPPAPPRAMPAPTYVAPPPPVPTPAAVSHQEAVAKQAVAVAQGSHTAGL